MESVAFHVGNRRLLSLAVLLRRVKPERLIMKSWACDAAPPFSKDEEVKLDCGTAACALGWATTIPALRRAGLKLEPIWNHYGKLHNAYVTVPGDVGQFYGFAAGAAIFGIEWAQSQYLFDFPAKPVTPKQMARKIENFVARRIKDRQKTKKATKKQKLATAEMA